MADRQAIRQAFYSELEAATTNVPADNITLEYPEKEEDYPAIVHSDSYEVDMYNIGSAPVRITTNTNGGEEAYDYAVQMLADFTCTVLANSETDVEPIYENVRRHFEQYRFPHNDASSIHSDVHSVEVMGTSPNDLSQREPAARGDRLTVTLGFTRYYTEDTVPTSVVNKTVGDA